MQQIVYRQLISTDYNEYKKLRLSCLMQHPDNFGTTYEEEFDAESTALHQAITTVDQGSFAFGAFLPEGKMVGICGFVVKPALKQQHRGEIVQLFVETSYTRQGIGKKLLRHIINRAFENKQVELILLGVVSVNNNAVSLYKKLGFVEYGRLENYFKTTTGYFTQLFLYLTNKSCRL